MTNSHQTGTLASLPGNTPAVCLVNYHVPRGWKIPFPASHFNRNKNDTLRKPSKKQPNSWWSRQTPSTNVNPTPSQSRRSVPHVTDCFSLFGSREVTHTKLVVMKTSAFLSERCSNRVEQYNSTWFVLFDKSQSCFWMKEPPAVCKIRRDWNSFLYWCARQTHECVMHIVTVGGERSSNCSVFSRLYHCCGFQIDLLSLRVLENKFWEKQEKMSRRPSWGSCSGFRLFCWHDSLGVRLTWLVSSVYHHNTGQLGRNDCGWTTVNLIGLKNGPCESPFPNAFF